MELHDELRASLRQTAAEIPPDGVPPLRLTGQGLTGHSPRAHGRRVRSWLTPLAAAAAVAAVATAAAVIPAAAPHVPGRHRSPATGQLQATFTLDRAPALAGIPGYSVALAPGPLADRSSHAVVRATATGAILATVTPPRPYSNLTGVTGAADDRTFVLSAQQWHQPGKNAGLNANGMTVAKFFLLRLNPAAGKARLTPLALPTVPASEYVTGLALSPDGGKLAVALSIGHGPSIEVFDLASGTMRRWQGSQRADSISSDLLGSNPLSWAADGRTLAFDLAAGRDIEVHLLDTSAPGDSLTASRQVMTFPDWAMTGSVSGSAVITPDGTKIVAMAVPAPLPGRQIQLREYSASTGKQLGVLARLHYRKHAITGWPNVLWTNSSGSRFIVSVTKPGDVPLKNGGMTAETIGILSGGRLTPLPGIPGGERPVW